MSFRELITRLDFALSKKEVVNENVIEFDGRRYQEQIDSIYKKLEESINKRFRRSDLSHKFRNISDIVKTEPPDLLPGRCEKDRDGNFYIPSYINIQIPSDDKDIDGSDIQYRGEPLSNDVMKKVTDDLSRLCIPSIKYLMKKCPFIDAVETDTKDYYFTLWVNIKKLTGTQVKDFSEVVSPLEVVTGGVDEQTLEGINEIKKEEFKNKPIDPDLKNYINSLIRKYYSDDTKIRYLINNGLQIGKELQNEGYLVDMDIVYASCSLYEIGRVASENIKLNKFANKSANLVKFGEINKKLKRTLSDEQINMIVESFREQLTGIKSIYGRILMRSRLLVNAKYTDANM